DPLYRKFRQTLGLTGGIPFAEDNRLYWHPATAGLTQLYSEQKVSVMPAIGYTHADQSHFTSRHYWEVGDPNANPRTGCLGRYLDVVGAPDNPLQGLSLDYSLAPALATAKLPVASIDAPDQYDFWSNNVWGEVETRMLNAIGSLGHGNPDPAFNTAAGLTPQADRPRTHLLPSRGPGARPGSPGRVASPKPDAPSPRRPAGLAAMLAAGLPLRAVSLSAPGHYDTHSNQANDLTQGLQLTSDSLL